MVDIGYRQVLLYFEFFFKFHKIVYGNTSRNVFMKNNQSMLNKLLNNKKKNSSKANKKKKKKERKRKDRREEKRRRMFMKNSISLRHAKKNNF